jgi:hypothetical protein
MANGSRRRRILIVVLLVAFALVTVAVWPRAPNPRFVGTWTVLHKGVDTGCLLKFKPDGTAWGYYAAESRWRWFRWHATDSRYESLPQLTSGFQPIRFVQQFIRRISERDASGCDILRIEDNLIELRERNPRIREPDFSLRRVKPSEAVDRL